MSKAAKKEEERIEKIIRDLLKLTENRRCINCTGLGPQYVCTTFWTFVCTNCSGVHREFTHRVKSVSIAKFSAEEVSALQAGGNERAREIYFKDWDPQRHTYPDGSNQNRLRDFIRQVYVDRKYAGDNTTKPAVIKTLESKEECSGQPSIENPSYGRRSTENPRRTEDSGLNYHSDGRSPRYKQETGKSRSRKARFEIVDNRFRDDDCGRGRRSNTNRVYIAESSSPAAQTTPMKTSHLEVRSIKDILGEDIPPLQLRKSLKDNNDGKNDKNIDLKENPASSSAKRFINAKSPEPTREKPVSLIDLMADPESNDSAAAPPTQDTATSTVGANEGLVESPTTVNASNAPQVNSLELMLFELSAPEEVSSGVNITNTTPTVWEPAGRELVLPCSGSDSVAAGNDGLQDTTQQLNSPAGTSSDQAWSLSPAPNTQSSSNAAVVEPSQLGLSAAQSSSVEAKSSGRGELPMDLFTASYPSFQAPVQNWQFRPPYGMGFNMYQQYPSNPVPGPSFPNSVISRNPFDLNDDTPQLQIPMYSPMLPVQDTVPNMPAHHAILNASHMSSSQFMQSQVSPYQAMPHTHIPIYGVSPGPGAFSGQQLPYGMPVSRSQGENSIAKEQQNDPFAALIPLQQHTNKGNTVPSTENSFPLAGGNPFG